MKVFNKISEISFYLASIRNANSGLYIGFVPTMGALHAGHLSLIKKSISENGLTICSIYVNPLQFNDKNDFEKYPRNYKADLELLKKEGCDIVFMPDSEEMNPEDEYKDYDLNGLNKVMEGKFRPGHFKGVVYIVKRFFEILQPDNAYFGMKDFQQLTIIKYVTDKFNLKSFPHQKGISKNINIVPCPIVRENDGLALSSRNIRLNDEQRKIAPLIYRTLLKAKDMLIKKSADDVKLWVNEEIEKIPLMRLEYFEIVDSQSLLPVSGNYLKNAIACIAVYLEDIRLIDNIILF